MRLNKKVIILIIIVLLIILAVILINVINKKNEQIYNETPVDIYGAYKKNRASEGMSEDDATVHIEDNINEYSTVKSIIDKLNRNVLYLNATAKDLDLIITKDQEAEVLNEYRQRGLKYIQDVLATNYKKKYSVDDKYIYNTLGIYANQNYEITDMYVVDDSEYINTYYIYGSYSSAEYNYIVVLDRYNYTFEIYLNNYFSDVGYSREKPSSMRTLNIKGIEKNSNNSYQYKNIDKEQMVNLYYDDYLNIINNNVEKAYNMLDQEYRQKRFDTIDKFNNYINNVINTNSNTRMINYTITQANGYTEYICRDNLGRCMIFKVTGAMKYTVALDPYTIDVIAYKNEYDNANNDRKIELSFNRFFECINNKDYESAYLYLNGSYRAENFPTVQDFKEYAETTWYNTNSFTYENIQVNSNNTYSVYGTIHDYETEGSYDSGFINKTFYIRLGSNYRDFEISFGK